MNRLSFILLLLLLAASCRKKEEGGLADIPYSEHVPPGWTVHQAGDNSYSTAMALDHSENIWLAGVGAHLFKYSPAGTTTDYTSFISPFYISQTNFLSSICIDNNDKVWVGITQETLIPGTTGLISFDGTAFHNYNSTNSGLTDHRVQSVVSDQFNIKWIGTASNLVKYDESTWTVYDSTNSPLHEFSPLLCTPGYTWIGGHHSLTRFDGAVFTSWDSTNSAFPPDGIRIMDKDNAGNIWFVGYNSTTLVKFDGTVFSSFTIPPAYSATSYGEEYRVIKSDGSRIWLSGYKKLLKFDGINWQSYSLPTFIPGGDGHFGYVVRYITPTAMVIKSDSSKWFSGQCLPLHNLLEWNE